jgi:signal transduction histidine kinase
LRKYFYIFIQIAGIFFSCEALGQAIAIEQDFGTLGINQQAWVYKKSIGIEAFQSVLNASEADFSKNMTSQDVSYGYHWPRGWCKFKIHNKSAQTRLIMHIEQSRADTVQLFVAKNTSNIDTSPMLGRHVSINKRIVFDRNYVYPIDIPKDSSYTYYLYSSRKVGLHGVILTLKTEKNYLKYFSVASSQFGFIVGTTLITALIGLALYGFIKERSYLIYSLYCLSTILVGLSDAGYIHSYFARPSIQPIINVATIISFYLLVGLHILFTIELLNIREYKTKWFYIVGKYATYLFIGTALVLFFPLPFKVEWWLVYLSYFTVFLMDFYIAIAIIIGIRKKHPSAYFYMVGFFLTLIIFTLLMLGNLGLLDDVNNKVDIFYFTPLIEIVVMIIGLGIRFSTNIKDRFVFQEKLNETQLQIITLQEDERIRIARDLHDDVGNSLAALKAKFSNENRADDASKTQQVINDLRDITHNIMPANFQHFMLHKMLETLIDRFEGHPKIRFDFIVAGNPQKLESNKELAIYRITNELITNILKHSTATEVTIQLVYQKDRVVLSIEDNGQPFSLQKQIHNTKNIGIGINSILARIDFIHAQHSTSTDADGNILIIDIPYVGNI